MPITNLWIPMTCVNLPSMHLKTLCFYQLLLLGDIFPGTAVVLLHVRGHHNHLANPFFLSLTLVHLFLSSDIFYFLAHSLILVGPFSSSLLRKAAEEGNLEKLACLIIDCMLLLDWFFWLSIKLKVVQHCYNPFRIIKGILSFIFFCYLCAIWCYLDTWSFDCDFFFFSRNFEDLLFVPTVLKSHNDLPLCSSFSSIRLGIQGSVSLETHAVWFRKHSYFFFFDNFSFSVLYSLSLEHILVSISIFLISILVFHTWYRVLHFYYLLLNFQEFFLVLWMFLFIASCFCYMDTISLLICLSI